MPYFSTSRTLSSLQLALLILFAISASSLIPATVCGAAQIVPFHTANQSPLVQIYGLPAPERSILLPARKTEGMLTLDIASNFASSTAGDEEILLDGESYRTTLILRRGFSDGIEGGIDIPFVGHGGGIFDNFIEGWHDFFGLPEGGRKEAPRDRLLYSYSKGGNEVLRMDRSEFGLGDIRLSGGVQLYNDGSANPAALAVRGSVKLPTGSHRRLHGSGSTDMSLWLTGSDDYSLPLGHFTLFGATGGMLLTDGDVLQDRQKNIVGFGSLGFGWAPAEWIALKVQASGHTPFYKGSDLRELGSNALQLLMGGTLLFPGDMSLDIGVSEDIAVDTSSDVALHLALRKVF